MLRYVNDSSRKIYAFELEPVKPDVLDNNFENSKTDSNGVAMETGIQGNHTNQNDVFSHMGSFNADACMFNAQSSYSNYPDTLSASDTGDTGVSTAHSGMTLSSDFGMTSDLGMASDLRMTSDPQNSDMIGTSMWEWSDRAETQEGDWNMSNSGISGPGVSSGVKVTSGVSDTGVDNSGNADGTQSSSLEDKWKSCAICLEELTDMELMVHTSCGGTFCSSCLEVGDCICLNFCSYGHK